MEPEKTFRTLVPRKDELQASRPSEGGALPAAYNLTVSHVPSLWDYWPIVLRHKWTILSAMLVALLVGTVVSFSTTPIYEAVGRVVINREGADSAALKNSDASGSDSYDDYMVAMDTQTHVFQSDAIAKLVIRKLNLDSDPAFAGKGATRANSALVASQAGSREIEPHQEAALVAKFHGALQLNSIPRTRLLEIRFSSSDPSLAAKAVNTVIDTYIEQNYKTHLDATTRTSDWLAVGVGPTMLAGLALVALSEVVMLRIASDADVLAREDLAFALSVVLLGMLMMVVRRNAVSMVVGFMSLENGLILAAAGAKGMPLVVEVSVAFSVLVALVVIGVFLFRISERFETVDAHALDRFRGDRR